jgi:hypothetical protein
MPARRVDTVLWFALGLALAAACLERPATRFPHALHLARIECGGPGHPECLTCATCHRDGDAAATQAREPRAVPPLDRCTGCHSSDAAPKLAASTRAALAPPPARAIQFSHEAHLAMAPIRGQCVPCHTGAVEASSTLFPPMQQCLGCHEHERQFERAECGPCHDASDVHRLVPESFLAHDASWLRHHGAEAGQHEALCATCHAQKECDDCHDLSQSLPRELRRPDDFGRERVHPPDFLSRHPLEAASQPARCATCHAPATCDGCHVQHGVSGQSADPFNPHPPGWVGGNPGSRDFHGRAARRNLLACAACHDQGPATNCIRCHSVGGYGGNPHPHGWQSARSEASSMCRYCHVR